MSAETQNLSALAEHRSTASNMHATEVKKNEQAAIAGKSIAMCKVTLEVPADSAISSDCNKRGSNQTTWCCALHSIKSETIPRF